MGYQRRVIDDELDELFDSVAAIAIDGPKAVGKTTTALERSVGVVRLDSSPVRSVVASDPTALLRRPRPLLVDEWQLVPEVWDVVRRAVDDDHAPGQFLLTGSASPAPGATSHTGAGRIGRLRMRPMSLLERGLETPSVSVRRLLGGARPAVDGQTALALGDYVEELVSTGFPGMRELTPRARRFQLDSYLRNVVDRDVPEAGLRVRRTEAMLDWLRAYAAATATTASYTQILDAATPAQSDKPARSTSVAYRDVLSQLWLLDPVPAWTPSGNDLARLQQTPKHHLADPGLAARLLGQTVDSLLDGAGDTLGPQRGSLLGHLFESLATSCVRVLAQAAEARVGHLRTRNGDHEVDLVLVRGDGRVLAIEVKLGGTIDDDDTRHLRWLAARLGPRLIDAVILNTGPAAYRRADGVAVVPLALLGL